MGEVEHGCWRGFLFGHVVCLLEKDLFPMQSNVIPLVAIGGYKPPFPIPETQSAFHRRRTTTRFPRDVSAIVRLSESTPETQMQNECRRFLGAQDWFSHPSQVVLQNRTHAQSLDLTVSAKVTHEKH